MDRDSIPAEVKRLVLVEAGHRCAIPTCRATTTEIAHIVPYADTQDNSFGNLIALCPNCHTRYDQKKEIDRKAMQMYKSNLAILNNRYGETERRVFALLLETNDDVVLLGTGGDISVANAVKDGLLRRLPDEVGTYHVGRYPNQRAFPIAHLFELTPKGKEFITKYSTGEKIE